MAKSCLRRPCDLKHLRAEGAFWLLGSNTPQPDSQSSVVRRRALRSDKSPADIADDLPSEAIPVG